MEYAFFSLMSLSPKKSNKMILEVSEESIGFQRSDQLMSITMQTGSKVSVIAVATSSQETSLLCSTM